MNSEVSTEVLSAHISSFSPALYKHKQQDGRKFSTLKQAVEQWLHMFTYKHLYIDLCSFDLICICQSVSPIC